MGGGGGGSKRHPSPVMVKVKFQLPGKGYSNFNQLRMSTKQKWGRYAVDTTSGMLLIRFYIYSTSWEFSKTFWVTLIPSFNVLICQKNVLEFQASHTLQNPLYHPISNGLTDNFNGVRGTVKNASREVLIHWSANIWLFKVTFGVYRL